MDVLALGEQESVPAWGSWLEMGACIFWTSCCESRITKGIMIEEFLNCCNHCHYKFSGRWLALYNRYLVPLVRTMSSTYVYNKVNKYEKLNVIKFPKAWDSDSLAFQAQSMTAFPLTSFGALWGTGLVTHVVMSKPKWYAIVQGISAVKGRCTLCSRLEYTGP